MAKIVRLHAFGGPEHLRIEDLDVDAPGAGEVRIRVLAARVTRDHARYLNGSVFKGHGFEQPSLPARIGYEAAGIVEAVGDGIESSWIGKRVSPFPNFDQETYGLLGEQAIVPGSVLIEYPSILTPGQAASFWVPYLTAYGLLVPIAHVRKDDIVVVLAANSAVGQAAMQIAHDAGAFVIGTTRHRAKIREILSLGADHAISLEDGDYPGQIEQLTGGKGARITLDPIGGSLIDDLAAGAAPGGIIVEYGVMSGEPAPLPIAHLIGKGLTIRGFTMNDILSSSEATVTAKQYILDRLADGQFSPRVTKVFPLEAVVDAFRSAMAGDTPGATVVSCSQDVEI